MYDKGASMSTESIKQFMGKVRKRENVFFNMLDPIYMGC